jgi:integrase
MKRNNSDEIEVHVASYGPGRALMLTYFDPITGKKVAKTSGTTDTGEALKAAGKWQDELNSGRYAAPSRITWADFRERVRREKLAPMPRSSQLAYETALEHLERIINPDRLAKLTAAVMTRFQTLAREGGMKPTTIARNLRHIKACLRWAERQGLIPKAPAIEMPKLPKGHHQAKHRPVTGEEFDRLLEAVPEVRPKDSAAWVRLLRGIWLSGLRLSEALALSWDPTDAFAVDMSGKRPVFRIAAEGQKSRQTEVAPITPDFAEFLNETPQAERVGRVFPMPGFRTDHAVGQVIVSIAETARIVIGTRERVKQVDGRLERETVKMIAGAHDLRRAFCTRWSRRVMPPVLLRLARHGHIATTMGFYVSSTAEEIGAELWAAWAHSGNTEASGNTLGNTAPKTTEGAKPANRPNPLPR